MGTLHRSSPPAATQQHAGGGGAAGGFRGGFQPAGTQQPQQQQRVGGWSSGSMATFGAGGGGGGFGKSEFGGGGAGPKPTVHTFGKAEPKPSRPAGAFGAGCATCDPSTCAAAPDCAPPPGRSGSVPTLLLCLPTCPCCAVCVHPAGLGRVRGWSTRRRSSTCRLRTASCTSLERPTL